MAIAADSKSDKQRIAIFLSVAGQEAGNLQYLHFYG